jgi:hypothetical protein
MLKTAIDFEYRRSVTNARSVLRHATEAMPIPTTWPKALSLSTDKQVCATRRTRISASVTFHCTILAEAFFLFPYRAMAFYWGIKTHTLFEIQMALS